MLIENGAAPRGDEPAASNARLVEKLSKINAVLMERVERSMDYQGSAFSLFQTAIALEAKVRARTEELTSVLRSLERSNAELSNAKEEADRANLSKTKFLAAASHDLLQPVNAAKLSLSALAEMQEAGDGLRLARQVESALQTIEDLIKTLLDISKLDAGVVKPEIRAFPLDDLLAGLAASFDGLIAAKGLELRVRQSGLLVESDPILLHRVLQNLVCNAVRYTARGGVLVGARGHGGMCHLDIVDTGLGIPDDERERIFDEFYRGSTSRQGEHAGLGLGLSIVKRIAQALGHGLEVGSRPGRGSRFRVILKASGPATPSLAQAQPQEITGSLDGAFVLIVENDRKVGEAMEQLFGRWSCHTFLARTLAEVGDFIAAADRMPDIVIADYHLEGGEVGLDAIGRLRQWVPGIPSLIVTADHSLETAEWVRARGSELLRKPVSPGRLRATVVHLLSDAAGRP